MHELPFRFLTPDLFSHFPMEKAMNEYSDLQRLSGKLAVFQNYNWTGKHSSTSSGYHANLFTEERQSWNGQCGPCTSSWCLHPFSPIDLLVTWGTEFRAQRGVKPWGCPQGVVPNHSFSFLPFDCPRHLS